MKKWDIKSDEGSIDMIKKTFDLSTNIGKMKFDELFCNEEIAKRFVTDVKHKEIDKDKVKIEVRTNKCDELILIYRVISKEQLHKIMNTKDSIYSQEYSIKLSGLYITDFNIAFAKEKNHINSLNVEYCFFDNNFSFSSVVTERLSFSIDKSVFGCSYIDFSNDIFKEGTISFNYLYLCNFDFRNVDFGNINIFISDSLFGGMGLNFNDVKFGENGNLMLSQLEISSLTFIRTKFTCIGIDFFNLRNKNCNINFLFCAFGDAPITITFDSLNRIVFHKQNIKANFYISGNKIQSLIFNECFLEKAFKVEAYLTEFSLLNSTLLGNLILDWDKCNVKKAINEFSNQQYINYHNKKAQFLTLKENYGRLGEYEYEDKAYREYMKYSAKWYLKVFKPVGGYGTRPLLVFVSALITIMLFGVGYSFLIEVTKNLGTRLLEGIYFSVITFLTIGYGATQPLQTSLITPLIVFLIAFEGFLGLFLMSYFTVAIARKILR